MASVCAEGQVQLLHHSEYSSPSPLPKHKKRHRYDLELAFPSPPRVLSPLPKISHWLHSLPPTQRQVILAVENPWATSLLRQMFARKLRDGEVLFTGIKNSAFESGKLEDYYSVSRSEEEASAYEREFEQCVRLCDATQYIDTITVGWEVINDFSRFQRLCDDLTHGSAFQVPCFSFWDVSTKSWQWECPGWLPSKTLTLSQFVLAILEKNCWMRFFEAMELDPRVPGEVLSYSGDSPTLRSSLNEIGSLVSFWKGLDKEKRTALVGDSVSLAVCFNAQRQTHQELQRKLFDLPVLQSYQSTNFLALFNNSSPYYSSFRGKIQHNMTITSLDNIPKMVAELSPGEFIDYLIKAPLERAGTIVDLVLRQVLEQIKEALRSQIAEDLLLTEPTVPKQVRKNKSGKKKKSRASSNASTTSSLTTHLSTSPDAEEPSSLEVANFILTLILNQVTSQLPTASHLPIPTPDSEEFQTVQARKKVEKSKKVKQWNGNSRNRKAKPKAKNLHIRPPTLESGFASPVIIKWANEESIQNSPALFQESMDFPPLASFAGGSFDQLTTELRQFRTSILEQMTAKSRSMVCLLGKLQEVMSCLFPGCFLTIFGSYATGLALPCSDLDLAVLNVGFSSEDVAQAIALLEEVLPAYRWVSGVQGITTASVPVVKLLVDPFYFSHLESEPIKVDITFEDDLDSCRQHLGIATCTWVRELLMRHPQTQECFLTLKQLLITHGLNSAYLGGLSSYSLVLWMGAFLQNNAYGSAGELLMSFLKFYGSEFNPKTTGVSNASEGKCYFSRTLPIFSPCETIDPTKVDNNTTKGAYRVGEVQELFKRAQEFLSACSAHGQNKLLSRLFAKQDLIKV